VADTQAVIDPALATRSHSPSLRRPQVVQLVVLGVLMYGAAVAVVRLFDHMINRDQFAQLRQQGGPLTQLSCATCATPGATLTAWATDERALLLWALIALATTAGIAISRQTSNARHRAAR